MLYIKEITLCDYLTDFQLKLPALGMYSVNSALKNEGAVLGAYNDETWDKKLVGVVTMVLSKRSILNYIFVDEAFRRKGIGTKLVKAALSYAQGKNMNMLEASMVMQNDYGEVIDHILKKAGFEAYTTATIVRYANDEKCKSSWAEFKNKRGSRICEGLSKRGFKTISFAEASDSVFKKLKAAMANDFPTNLDPFHFIPHKDHKVVNEYSFITLKDDIPAAFVTVTTLDGKTLVFQQLSVAFKHQGNGSFLLPFAAFMEKFLKGNAYNKASALIYDNNDKMKKLVDSFIGEMAESIKMQNVYKHTL